MTSRSLKLEDFQMPRSQETGSLGKGAFSNVQLAKHKSSGRTFAIKIVA